MRVKVCCDHLWVLSFVCLFCYLEQIFPLMNFLLMGGVDSKGLGPRGGRLAAGCMGDSVFGKIFYPLPAAQATSDSLLNRCWEIQTSIVPGLLLRNTNRHCAWSPWMRLSSLCCSHSLIRLHPFSLTKCCTVSWTGSNSVTRCLGSLFLQPWRPCPTHLDIHSSSPLAWTPPGLCSLQRPSPSYPQDTGLLVSSASLAWFSLWS